MGRIVTIPLRDVTLTTGAAFDIFSVGTSADYRGILHMLSLTSNAAAEQFLDLALVTRSTAGSGGTAITEVPVDQGNTRTPSFTAVYNNTTPGTLGNTLFPWQWSMRNELLFIPTPELRPVVSVSSWLALHCASSITGTIKLNGFAVFEEF